MALALYAVNLVQTKDAIKCKCSYAESRRLKQWIKEYFQIKRETFNEEIEQIEEVKEEVKSCTIDLDNKLRDEEIVELNQLIGQELGVNISQVERDSEVVLVLEGEHCSVAKQEIRPIIGKL